MHQLTTISTIQMESLELPQPLKRWSHLLPTLKCLYSLSVNLCSLFANLYDGFHQRWRYYHNAISISYEIVPRIDPEALLELKRDINL